MTKIKTFERMDNNVWKCIREKNVYIIIKFNDGNIEEYKISRNEYKRFIDGYFSRVKSIIPQLKYFFDTGNIPTLDCVD